MSLSLLCNYESSDEDEEEDTKENSTTAMTPTQPPSVLSLASSGDAAFGIPPASTGTEPYRPVASDTISAAHRPPICAGNESDETAQLYLTGVEKERQYGGLDPADDVGVPYYDEDQQEEAGSSQVDETGSSQVADSGQAPPGPIFPGIGRSSLPWVKGTVS
jgi:hypothetical protein